MRLRSTTELLLVIGLSFLAVGFETLGASLQDPFFRASFDSNLNASPGAPNPFPASNLVEIVEARGAIGRAARFVGASSSNELAVLSPNEQSALIFSGENVPSGAGWIKFRLRTNDRKKSDSRRRWIVALPPVVGELYFETNETGLGLGLIQESNGDLALAIHRFEKGRLTADYRSEGMKVGMAAPDATPIRFPATPEGGRGPWRSIQLGWDQEAGRVLLGVDGDIRSADLDFPATRFRALILGSPPKILHVQDDVGFSGYLDELEISGIRDPSRRQGPDPVWGHRNPDTEGADKVEVGVRRHLETILDSQRLGGWGPLVALPSGLHFLSAPTLLPYGDRFYFGKGRASSIIVALILLRGYEVLADPRYLEAARSMGELLIRLQTERGAWPAQAILPSAGPVVLQNTQYAILNDRIQTMPILLLWRLHDLIGDERFEAAAARGVSFLLRSQNASGSWPNRVVVASWRRESMSGLEGGGEINDFTTSDAMNIMLIMYRRTGDVEYLSRYLRGADWLARVFQDGTAKGWAKQYDAFDCPITARHHEPIGVAFREMDDVPRTLVEATLLTGSTQYREVLSRWATYVQSVRDDKGWYPYYDISTGKPIKRIGGRMVPPDPKERRDYGVTKILRLIEGRLDKTGAHKTTRPDLVRESARLRKRALQVLESMDLGFGTWLSVVGVQGAVMNPNSPRVLTMLHALAIERSMSQPDSSFEAYLERGWRDEDWRDEFGHVMSSNDRFARLDMKTVTRAELRSRKFKSGPSIRTSPCKRGEPAPLTRAAS